MNRALPRVFSLVLGGVLLAGCAKKPGEELARAAYHGDAAAVRRLLDEGVPPGPNPSRRRSPPNATRGAGTICPRAMPRRGPRTIEARRLVPGAKLPTRAHPGDAGLDLYAAETVSLRPGQGTIVKTGVAVAVPKGHVGLVADRSSMARSGLKTAGGVIDAGYRGEVGIILWNISRNTLRVAKGDRVAQLLLLPIAVPAVKEVTGLSRTRRGKGGFGSTGR